MIHSLCSRGVLTVCTLVVIRVPPALLTTAKRVLPSDHGGCRPAQYGWRNLGASVLEATVAPRRTLSGHQATLQFKTFLKGNVNLLSKKGLGCGLEPPGSRGSRDERVVHPLSPDSLPHIGAPACSSLVHREGFSSYRRPFAQGADPTFVVFLSDLNIDKPGVQKELAMLIYIQVRVRIIHPLNHFSKFLTLPVEFPALVDLSNDDQRSARFQYA